MTAQLLFPLVLSGFILAPFAPWLQRHLGRWTGWLISLLPLAIVVFLLSQLTRITHHPLHQAYEWVPTLGVQISFYLDGLSLLLALIISGIGALVLIYAGEYLHGDRQQGRFFTLILIFMAAMLGVVLADNLLLLFIFWELTSISSYLLIGYKHEDADSRRSALQALLVTGGGGLLLLAGLIFLGILGGSWELSTLLATNTAVSSHSLYPIMLFLILIGAFSKSAQFPFHFWLPNAMVAPTPVSTYLHSATMVKAGIYLLARLHPLLGDTTLWLISLTTVGGFTALLGAWLSWQQTDLKRILAYSTVSALGILVMFLGIGTELAIKTAILFLVVHALYKGALFMATGAIDHATGTRDILQLGDLVRQMPWIFAGVVLAVTSMAGIPPLIGFIGKELMYEATLEAHNANLLLTAVILTTNIFMVLAAAIIAIKPFLSDPPPEATPVHRVPFSLWLGPLLLGSLALWFGLNPDGLITGLAAPAAAAVSSAEVDYHLTLWHGFTPAFIMSIITIGSAAGLYLIVNRLRPTARRWDASISLYAPEQWYEWSMRGLRKLARAQAHVWQNGRLRRYLQLIMLMVVGVVGTTLVTQSGFGTIDIAWDFRFYELLIVGVIVAAAVFITRARSRLAAVVLIGVVGYGIAFLYILFGAPDLAMTQFAIETLSVILFVLVMYRLPVMANLTNRNERFQDMLIAGLVGIFMTALVLVVVAVTPESGNLTQFFAENSYELGQGLNVVNVILVDFRGLDTMIEIAVLSVAALGVYALTKWGDN